MSQARLEGTLRSRLAAAVRQLSEDTPYSIELLVQDVVWAPGYSRIFQDYRGDISGRYLGAIAVAVEQGFDVNLDKAATVLRRVLDAQQADGSFGPPMPGLARDHGAAWGHGRLLDGLLDARTWVGPDQISDLNLSIDRLAQFMVTTADAWASWLKSTDQRKFLLDPLSMVRPLVRHGGAESLIAARQLVDSFPAMQPGLHMHGYLLFLRGALALGLRGGADHLISRVVSDTAEIDRRFLLPGGSPLESLSEPWDVNTEGCGTADWIMLNLELYAATSDATNLERALLATYNGLLHSQAPSGHFGCQTLADGSGALLVRDYAPEAWWCCTFHAIQSLGSVADALLRSTAGGVAVDALLPFTDRADQQAAGITISGDYPFEDLVRVTVSSAQTVSLRIPRTATVAEVNLNGASLTPIIRGERLTLSDLTSGDVVEVRLHQHLWFAIDGVPQLPPFANTTARPPDFSRSHTAAYRGALLMSANASENDPEDLVRAQFVVSPRDRRTLGTGDGDGTSIEASGHDSFTTSLFLRPLSAGPVERMSRLVRISFRGLLFEHGAVHVLEH